MKGENKMGNIAKGSTIFETALAFINTITKIMGFNEQSWLEIIFPFIGFFVCLMIFIEVKKVLKEKEEVEDYFNF